MNTKNYSTKNYIDQVANKFLSDNKYDQLQTLNKFGKRNF